MTPDEKLAAARTRCEAMRAEPGQGDWYAGRDSAAAAILDVLDAPSVGAAEPHDTTRDALRALVLDIAAEPGNQTSDQWVDAILAVVRPGITLTPEEARLAAKALRLYDVRDSQVNALAARLEGAAS